MSKCWDCREEAEPGKSRCAKHAASSRANVRRQYWAKREDRLERNQAYYHNLKAEVFSAYGNRCACCREDWIPYLELDHIYGDGAQHRYELTGNIRMAGGAQTYLAIKRAGFPNWVQLLCANCHRAKTRRELCKHGRNNA